MFSFDFSRIIPKLGVVQHLKTFKTITMKENVQRGASSGAFYFFGFIGAAIYFIGQATSFWPGVLGFLKACIWPVFFILEGFKHFAGL